MVYSDADRNSPHVRAGDEAVHIGASYLAIDAIIDAARKVGANAVHPGYGFLSENGDFAEACVHAGLIFIGPSAKAIRAMGLKKAGREIAVAAGVPVVPSFESGGDLQFPVLIKASAGGGGRGMRIVTESSQLDSALESAEREAERAFGDGSLLIERYIEGARHVEIQIFGDLHGNLIHMFERDCSVQRRHQKIIEESPSPALNDELRQRMGEAATAIGKAIEYTNAGTVEFLVAPSGEFFFIEVNTRIQVEHPVTELVTGLDLVRSQIEVAEGKKLPRSPRMLGHAIEARLYAEDPKNGFLPSTGKIHVWRPPKDVRVDTSVEAGTEIGIHYDPMLAKIISYGMDRESAIRKLVYALRSTAVLGVQTNRDYLIQILESDEFREGRAHTGYLPEPKDEPGDASLRVAAAVLYLDLTRKRMLTGVPPNYRNNPYRDPSMRLRVDGTDRTVHWKNYGQVGDLPHVANRYRVAEDEVEVMSIGPGRITLLASGIARAYEVHEAGEFLFVQSSSGASTIQRLPRHPRPASASQRETANSPMPGQVLRILVSEGQRVKTGDSLVVLEAMKMEQTIRTTIDGVIQSILVETGQVVAPGQMLVQISAQENDS